MKALILAAGFGERLGPITRSMIIAHVRTVIWPLNSVRAVQNEFNPVSE